jgi:TetR/AcrR family transcriptional regulator
MTAPTSPRTRGHNVDLDKEIIDAAQRLMHTRGDDGFTIQQLVDEAGVALQTFYRHFGGKDELLLALLERSVAEFCAGLRRATNDVDDPIERLHRFVTGPLGLLRGGDTTDARAITHEHFRLYQMYPAEVSRATGAFVALVLESLEDARQRGLATSPEPQRDAWMITELVMTTFHHYSFRELGPDADAVIEHLWHFCRAAIGSARDETE